MRSNRLPAAIANMIVVLFQGYREGAGATVHGDVRRVLGRDPISVEQFIADSRAAFTA